MKKTNYFGKSAAAVLLALLICLASACSRPEEEETIEKDPEIPAISQPEPNLEPERPPEPAPELEPESEQEPEPEPWVWRQEAPEDHGVDAAALEALHRELDGTQVLASVIVKDGVIVDEYYKEGYDSSSPFAMYSVSKSFTSALIGIAIDQGYIESVDTPISTWFPQLLESENPAARQITLRHLLTHTSGLQGTDGDLWESWRASEDWMKFVLDRSIAAEPGTTFDYSTGNTHLLAAILQQAVGMTEYEYGKQTLFDPLGMDSVTCDMGPQGISDGGNGFHMNVYDMAKFGQLFLDGGQWQGRQIVPAQWAKDSISLQFKRSSGSADYGYQWWVRTFGQRQHPAFFAQGHFGQYIFVVPDLQLVALFTSYHTGGSSMYWRFANEIVEAAE